ncbi:MAG: outer membrane protein assembly factor BamC [Xanthomonadales bacterium]|nr:outer membrane protein assembly factor BamC [Xanthomonadales bacterium]
MMHLLKTPVLAIALVLTIGGCSLFGDRQPDYVAGREGEPLKVPDDLDAPRQVSPVVIRVDPMPLPPADQLDFKPPRAAVTAGGGEANAFIAWSSRGAYLAVKDSPNSVMRRLRFAIERSGMNLVERDDEQGHVFSYRHARQLREKGIFERLLFWRDDYGPDYSGTYQLNVAEDGEVTRVYLETPEGGVASPDVAEHILGIFMERLG